MNKKIVVGSIAALIVLSALAAQVLRTDERFGGSTRFISPSQYQVTVESLDDAVLRIDFINKPAGVFTNFSNPIYLTRTGLVANVVVPGGSLWTNTGTVITPITLPTGGILIGDSLIGLKIGAVGITNTFAHGQITSNNVAAVDIFDRWLLDYTGNTVLDWGSPGTVILTTPTIASFVNATHTHLNAAGGGTLSASAIASGTIAAAQMPALTGAITTSAGAVATSLGSFSSANLATALTDETGTGATVFGTAPTFTTSITTPQTYYTTNSNPVIPDFTLAYQLFQTNAAFTFLAPVGVDTTKKFVQTTCVFITNSTAAAVLITAPANVHTQGTWYVTNVTAVSFVVYPFMGTNAIAYPLW